MVWSSSLLSFIAVGEGSTHYSAKTNQSIYGTNFVWRLATTTAIIGNQSIGNFAIGNIAATMTAISNATWCVIDQFAGTAYSQAILTFPVAMVTATMASGIGVVGYNQAGTLSTTPTYYGPLGRPHSLSRLAPILKARDTPKAFSLDLTCQIKRSTTKRRS